MYGGELPAAPENADSPHLFTAVQEQLGLKLVAASGMVNYAMVVPDEAGWRWIKWAIRSRWSIVTAIGAPS